MKKLKKRKEKEKSILRIISSKIFKQKRKRKEIKKKEETKLNKIDQDTENRIRIS